MKKAKDENGIIRFQGNQIVRWCLFNDTDLNQIWRMAQEGYFTRKEMREFYKLIGYSESGYNGIDFTIIKP